MKMIQEQKAYRALLELFADAKECRRLFESAGLELPDPLRRFLGDATPARQARSGSPLSFPPPEAPERPTNAEPEWVWIHERDLSVQLAVLAVLRKFPNPMPVRRVMEQVKLILPDVNEGSISNVGTRLDGKRISRSEGGWGLVEPDDAPILHRGYAWGNRSALTKQELAAHRRIAILHLLRMSNDGLQTMQITRSLERVDWLQAPLSKFLVKADLAVLRAAGRVRMAGGSRKWVPVPEPVDPK